MNKMKKNSSTYIIALLLVVALMASVALVVKKQDTRKGAFAGGQMYLLDHNSTISAEVGDNIDVQLYVESTDGAKVSQVRSVLCYGSEVELFNESNVGSNVEVNIGAGFFAIVIAIKTTATNGDSCINLTVTSGGSADDLMSGAVRIAKVKFKAVAVGTGEIDIDDSRSRVAGVNPDNNDKIIDVNQFFGRPYNVSGSVGPTNTPIPTVPPGQPTNTPVPTAIPTAIPTVPPGQPTNTPVPTAIPTAIPTEVPATSWVVPFKISFAGLRNAEVVCGQGWPVDVMVMGNGQTQVHTDVNLTKTEDKTTGGEAIFTGRVVLGESPETGSEDLALFVKGPMHLQVKYAEDGQSEFYRQSGGQIVAFLTGTSMEDYDFSGYPILAGDVTGETAGVPDGRVNGLDFSYVKSKIRVDKSPQSDGDMLNGDFDGDCWIGNVDLAVLMLTLKDKQDQLY